MYIVAAATRTTISLASFTKRLFGDVISTMFSFFLSFSLRGGILMINCWGDTCRGK